MSKRKKPAVQEQPEDKKEDSSSQCSQCWFDGNKAFVTRPAPSFVAKCLMPDQTFSTVALDSLKGRYVVLFFYPLDFTFVCPTEIVQFSDRVAEFEKLGCQLVGASVDSEFSHLAWTNQPRKSGGLGRVNVPLIADVSKAISRDYGVLVDGGIALRGLFIIDRKGTIRHITKNDLPVGRNVDEVVRLVKAFQFVDEHGEVCPAGWTPGSKTMKADPKGSQAYFNAAHKE